MGKCFSKNSTKGKVASAEKKETMPNAPIRPTVQDMKKAHILYVTLKCNWEGTKSVNVNRPTTTTTSCTCMLT